MVKLCKDCKHFTMADTTLAENAKCTHPSVLKPLYTSLITGEQSPMRPSYCDLERQGYGKCGPEGKLWEPRNA